MSRLGPTNYEKARNAERMFGTRSPEYAKMLRRLCTCACASGGFCGGCGHAGCGGR